MSRLYLLLVTFGFCLIGGIAGDYLSTRLDLDAPSALAAAAFPTIGAYLGGVRDRGLLTKIAAYSCLGWLLCFVLEPQASRTAFQAPSIDGEFGGKHWRLICFVPSTLLAMVAILFAPERLTRR